MRSTLKFLLALGAAMIIMLAIRAYVLTLYTVPDDSFAPSVRQGQRVAVGRLWHTPLRKGQLVVFRDDSTQTLGRIEGVPGDCLRVGGRLYRLYGARPCDLCGAGHEYFYYLVGGQGWHRLVSHYDIIGRARPLNLFGP